LESSKLLLLPIFFDFFLVNSNNKFPLFLTDYCQYYSDSKIQEIRDSLIHFQDALNNVADSHRLKDLQKQFSTLSLTNNTTYWRTFKNKSVSDALTQLTTMQNQIEMDKVACLNHIFNYTGSNDHHRDTYKLVISSQKTALIEGETFNANISLSVFSTNLGSETTFIVNGKVMPIKGGIAYFKATNLSVGTKKVKAEARIRNPLTGHITTENAEFEYEVLPKYSRDCK
jgi:hypothetical protein